MKLLKFTTLQVPLKSSSRINPEEDLKSWLIRRRVDVSNAGDKTKEANGHSISKTSLGLEAWRLKDLVVTKGDQQEVEQKEPLANDDAKVKDQDSKPSTHNDQGIESIREKTKTSMDNPSEVVKPVVKPMVKPVDKPVYTQAEVNEMKADYVFLIFLFVITVIPIIIGFGGTWLCHVMWERNILSEEKSILSEEKSVLSEKIIFAKELMKLKGIYDDSKMRQVVDVLEYDFVEHSEFENVKEEELIKATFKHFYKEPHAIDKLMKLKCREEHTRIYILAKCSQTNNSEYVTLQCRSLYEKCGMI